MRPYTGSIYFCSRNSELAFFSIHLFMSNSPFNFKAAILDMDGVITQTAKLHAKAWKQMFDEFLEKRQGSGFSPMSIEEDYLLYIDGKGRYEGARSFLSSRNLEIPEGMPTDTPDKETVYGLGMRKNTYFREILENEGVQVYQDTLRVIQQWKEEEIKLAVVSSSRNCKYVMEAAAASFFRCAGGRTYHR